ncbi:urea amidolyase [Aspergillus sclerotiicarbonarius CBS 121057]|uniref:Urea amidolyase n=1 Tax=Aspergillus sclerotiicarbonarius (strain CBS 121057 / IBT 28362) TaxID=1448318 RepID=A0A319DWG4_ASPSB|nr:urea amidolyase [Aspergillus sclerotiicarbonarius CBS 121057]
MDKKIFIVLKRPRHLTEYPIAFFFPSFLCFYSATCGENFNLLLLDQRISSVIAQWEKVCALGSNLPLFGVPFAVKDNIDVAGFGTTAACPAFGAEKGVAAADSTVVARLKAQGAIVLGKTNLDQFATGLVGTRSPYGAVRNPFDGDRVSGGSSSGSGVVVSQGLVPFALGTDTAGSGRVPAGFNNVVGLKPTRGALSTSGVLPACRSLDCVSIFALTLDDAEMVLGLAEGPDGQDAYSRARPEQRANDIESQQPVLAICDSPEWFGQSEHADAYEAALAKAQRLGWTLEAIDFSPLFALASLLYEGPWVAERYAAIKTFLKSTHTQETDSVVRGIIFQAERFSAVDVFQIEYRRQELASQIGRLVAKFDAILVPTTPTFPTTQELKIEPVLANSRLGTYTNFVNLMDWSALAIPANFRADGLPFGITLIGEAWKEPRLLGLGRQWLADAPRLLGATKRAYREERVPPGAVVNPEAMQLVVVGAHLSGLPLNKDLVMHEAKLVAATRTAPCYRLFALQTGSSIPKPGLKRVGDGGASIEVEVWELPLQKVGGFLTTVPSPLGIGSVELQDGRWVQGFICEPFGLANAEDITRFGGWRNYVQSLRS